MTKNEPSAYLFKPMSNNNSLEKNQEIINKKHTQPVIELSELILITDGDQAQLKELLTRFYTDYLLKSQEIKQALQEKKLLVAQRHAHNIAGSAHMIGAEKLQLASQTLDYSLRKEHAEPELCKSFLATLEQTLLSLNKYIISMH
jgi:HPt (histidine-containing phosphotransfer) domain-containing protein